MVETGAGHRPADAAAARAEPLDAAAQRAPRTTAPRCPRGTTTGASSATGSPSGGATSRRSARPPTSGSARCAGAASGSSPRWTRRCSGPPRAQVADDLRGTTTRGRLPTAVVAARHRPGAGHGGEPALQRRADNPAGQQNYPNTVNQLVAGGGGIDGLPGRLDVQAVHPAGRAGGRPAAGDRVRRAQPAAHPVPGRRGPASCGGRWCPANANPEWMDGYRDHVDARSAAR